ncbi:hypothetical protein SAMN05660748_2343 [Blastococcus aggregatus]|uniref:Uncharacterized protein n=1 Tax=Blastococcus aggregatus TaxID=38502 RepID=A0A285V670_9ACTN|nr:hypothetical protein SAMN05660748_2343 [Blastococcus aggregatus]
MSTTLDASSGGSVPSDGRHARVRIVPESW